MGLLTGWKFPTTGQRQIEGASGECVWIDVEEEEENEVSVPVCWLIGETAAASSLAASQERNGSRNSRRNW